MNNEIQKLILSYVYEQDSGIMIFDSDENLIYVNKFIHDYSLESNVFEKNKSFSEIFPDMIDNRIHECLRNAIRYDYPSFISHSLNNNGFPLYARSELIESQDNKSIINDESKILQSIYILPLYLDKKNFCLVQINNVTEVVERERFYKEQKVLAKNAVEQLEVVKRALNESESKYKTLLETIPDIVYKIDPDGYFIFVNKAIKNLGYKPEELIGRHFSSIIDEQDLQRISLRKVLPIYKGKQIGEENSPKVFDERRTGDRITQNLQIRLKPKYDYIDGPEITGEVSGLFDLGDVTATGNYSNDLLNPKQSIFHGTIGIIRNISKIKHTEELLWKTKREAEEMSTAKSNFLAMVSHEIRTPMNGIIGMIDLLLNTELSQEQKEFVDTIHLSGHTLITIIDDILDFTKAEFGKIVIREEIFELAVCLEDVLDLYASNAQKKNIELVYKIDNDVPVFLNGDDIRLKQVLNNLVNNAIKFTEQGNIKVNVHNVSQENSDKITLHFSVSDTGIGISKDKINKLFNPFNQGDNITYEKYGGTGLGLAICLRLVQLMHGEMWVNSRVQEGSSFNFILKMKKVDCESPACYLYDKKFEKYRVAYYNTNDMLQDTLIQFSKKWGLDIQIIGRNNFDIKENYDAVIFNYVDMKRDEMRKFGELFSQLNKNIKYILLVSKGQKQKMVTALSNNNIHLVSKPIRRDNLYKNLLNILINEKIDDSKIIKAPINKEFAKKHFMQILLVEDNLVNQKVANKMLHSLGFHIDLAVNGEDAVALYQERKHDLIFMDVEMPRMDGLQATKKIRSIAKKNHDPVIIAMTAHVLESTQKLCHEAGMNDFLHKPINIEKLQNAIKNWFHV